MMIVRNHIYWFQYYLSEHFNIRHSFPINYGEQKKKLAFHFSNKAGHTTGLCASHLATRPDTRLPQSRAGGQGL